MASAAKRTFIVRAPQSAGTAGFELSIETPRFARKMAICFVARWSMRPIDELLRDAHEAKQTQHPLRAVQKAASIHRSLCPSRAGSGHLSLIVRM